MQPPYPAYPMYPPAQRPLGISLLAVLSFLAGLLLFLSGLAIVAGGLLLGLSGLRGLQGLGAFVAIIGGFILFMGILGLALGWGLWSLRPWARTLAIVFAILNLLLSLLLIVGGGIFAVVGLVIAALILWYLYRPEVKAAFGVGPAPVPMGYGYPAAYGVPSAPSPAYGAPLTTPTAYCSHCGTPVIQGTTNCPSCGANLY